MKKGAKGFYLDEKCEKRDEKKGPPKGKYELGNSKFTAAGTGVAFAIQNHGSITCEASSSAGELTGGQTGTETITYTGCKLGAEGCSSSGQAAGTIKTGRSNSSTKKKKNRA